MYYQLGTCTFQRLFGAQSIEHSDAIEFATMPLFGLKPKVQFVGHSLKTITLSVRFHASFCDVAKEVGKIDEMLKGKESQVFLTGDGTFYGNFFLTSFRKTFEKVSPTGTLESVLGEVSVMEDAYPPKTVAGKTPVVQQIAARKFSLSSIESPRAMPPPGLVSEERKQVLEAVDIAASTKTIYDRIRTARANVAEASAWVQKAISTARKVQNQVMSLYSATGRFQGLLDSVGNVLKHLGDAGIAIASGDIPAASAEITLAFDSISDVDIRVDKELLAYFSASASLVSAKRK